jgi:ubiquinone/menaquinone biosynthesis C-methylase UbiE
MVTRAFDPVKYKVEQRREWDAVAAGWRRWWVTVERGAQAMSDHMVLLAQVQTGDKVLDIATGYGEPALTAAQRVGPSGRVIGIDLAPQLLAIARDRATSHGFKQVDFYEMDAEELSLPNDTFDAALCRLGLMYFPNVVATLESIKRHLKIGGRFVAAVWCTPEEAPVEGLPEDLATKKAHVPLFEDGIPGPFSLTDSKTVEQRFTLAGFSEVQSEKLDVAYEFGSLDDYILYLQDTSAPLKAIVARMSAERQSTIWDDIKAQAARDYLTSSGKLIMPGEVICVVGRR